jgi:hypothetical protein
VEKPFHLQRGVLVTGTVYGKAEGASEDISKYSKQELESFAKIVVNNATKISNPISKNLRSYKIIKINGLNALKILFDKSARVNNGILFSISEIIVTFYDQNFIGERAFSSIVLLCSYTGFANDKDLIIKSFNNQHDEICQRFYSSLEILDKWK